MAVKDVYYPPYGPDEVLDSFVHLHNHSDYSLLDGAATIGKYMAKAREYKMQALAITDHGNMYGALRFYNACKAANIKPIIGCEFYVNPKNRRDMSPVSEGNRYYHLILLAMNDRGYHHLMELNSIAFTEGFYGKPRIDDEVLVSHSDDLICLSACLGGEILQLLLDNEHKHTEEQCYQMAKERAAWFKSVFGDRYYIELQDHDLPEQKRTNPLLVKIARELDIPLVCTNDIHYINRDDANAHDILLCIGTNHKKNEENRMRFPNDNFYFKSGDEMREIFKWCPEAIENTKKIADRIDIKIKFPGPLLPEFEVPDGFSDTAEYLVWLSYDGCKKRYGKLTPELKARLDYELGIILKMDFQGYFLIVRDYIHWAKMHDIPVGPGRGSGAGSLVAYSITITDVDPMKYSLLFERFLNPERVSMPDFDIDFCFERRGEVIQYVTDHYGKDRVGQICTFGTLKAKAVVKDVARALDIPYDESTAICKLISDDAKNLKQAFEMEPKLQEIVDRGGVYAELFDVSKRLEGGNRHTSLHAAGVVIGKTPLIDYVPLNFDPKTKSVASQYTMDLIEDCGLVKMDFLGLKTLTLIKHAVDLIHKVNPSFDINKIDEEDPKTFEMLCAGDSACVFQFESGGMQKVLRDAQPNTIEDLVALNALYRPGPMQYIERFVKCKNGVWDIEYDDPDLEPVLKNTYGICVYQEQVMQVAQIIAGYTLGEADILRRIMGKKKVDQLAEQKVKFVAGAKKLGRTEELALKVFANLEPFAQYGFNKSHAVAYSIVAYQTAFMKANYPAEFLAANLTNEMGNPDKYKEYLALADTMGIRMMPPDINASEKHFNVVNGNIVYGLAGIRNVGEQVTQIIVEEREKNGPYKSMLDFIGRQPEGLVNSRLLESLIKSGTFDSLSEDRATLMANLDDMIAFDKSNRDATAYGQIGLFEDDMAMQHFEMRPATPWTKREMLEMEKEFLGFYVSGHPLDDYKEDVERCVWVDISKPKELPLNRTVSLICQVNAMKIIKTQKDGKKMGIFTLSNYQGIIDSVAFPKSYEALDGKIQVDGIYGFTGKFDNSRDADAYQFIIESVCAPSELKTEAITSVCFEIDDEAMLSEHVDQLEDELKKYIIDHQGGLQVYAYVGENRNEKVRFGREYSLAYSKDLKRELMSYDLIKNVWYA